jgi:hypothetical protein
LVYATVRKERKKGRVVSIRRSIVLGDEPTVEALLKCIGMQPHDKHLVRGTATRDRPGPELAEVAAKLPLQQGLGCPRGDVLLRGVSVYLLLAIADATDQGRGWPLAAMDTSDGSGVADIVRTLKEWINFPAIQCK